MPYLYIGKSKGRAKMIKRILMRLRCRGSSRTRVNGQRERVSHLKMENKIGRDIKKHEVIHHIDGNDRNDKMPNLMLLTQKEHGALERKIGKYQKENKKRPSKKWQEEYIRKYRKSN